MLTYSWVRSQVRKRLAAVAVAEVDGDGVFAGEHGGVGGGFVVGGGADAVGEDGQAGDGDGDVRGVEGDAGVAGGGEQAAPVGIGGGPGGFAERGVWRWCGRWCGVGVGAGAGDVERDDVGDAFAVVDDGVGELSRRPRCSAASKAWAAWAFAADAACAAGEQEHGVVGGGVAVDGDGVEAGVRRRGRAGV